MPERVSRWWPNWRWGEKDRVFWGASLHEIGSYIHTLLSWCIHTPLLCTRLGARLWKKIMQKKKEKKSTLSLLPRTLPPKPLKVCFYLIMRTFTQSLVFPTPSLTLFCRKVRGTAFATNFLPRAKPTKVWWFGAPQGYPVSPIPTLWWIRGPEGQSEPDSYWTQPEWKTWPCVLDSSHKGSGEREAAAPGRSPWCNWPHEA